MSEDPSVKNKDLYPNSIGLNENINTKPVDESKIVDALNDDENKALSGLLKQVIIRIIKASSANSCWCL